VFGGPPIAVTCECGEKHDAAYGEVWTCERCGRRWDTNQIPREDYDVIRRTQLRFRALPALFGMLVASVTLFFILTHNTFSVFFLLPVALSVWFVFLRPVHRRRYRAAIANLPRWELHPE
jgi:Flp pilus assembly protein TadB